MMKIGDMVTVIDAYGKPTGEQRKIIHVEEQGGRIYAELE